MVCTYTLHSMYRDAYRNLVYVRAVSINLELKDCALIAGDSPCTRNIFTDYITCYVDGLGVFCESRNSNIGTRRAHIIAVDVVVSRVVIVI